MRQSLIYKPTKFIRFQTIQYQLEEDESSLYGTNGGSSSNLSTMQTIFLSHRNIPVLVPMVIE